MSWYDWYTKLRRRWEKKGEKQLKLCNPYCVDPLCFVWIGCSTCQMLLTDDLCEVHKRRSGISLVMNSKMCADDIEWS